MISPILLDTCAAIWSTEPGRLSEQATVLITRADSAGIGVYVSPITGWEIGQLVARGRLSLELSPKLWMTRLLERGVRLAPLSTEILVDSSFLPGDLHCDPADRILAATAREFGYRLMTRDRPLLAYAEAGHLQAIAC